MDRGVLGSQRFQTPHPSIYAAGDAAQAHDRAWGEPRVNTSWRTAREQGECAGICMAGGGGEYPGALGINVQLAAGLPFCAIGMANPPDVTGCSVEVSADERARTYRKLVRRGRRLVGACLVGAVDDVGKIERSIGQPTIA